MSLVGDPNSPKPTTPRPGAPAGGPKPVSRPVGGANGAAHTPQLKRKASGPVENSQVKVQRKEATTQTIQKNGAAHATSTSTASKPTTPVTTSVPYRGTAAPSSAVKGDAPALRKPLPPVKVASTAPKAVPNPTANPRPAPNASAAAPKKGYLALLQQAKEKESTRTPAPLLKHEPAKILTKKERMALKAEANAAAKGKKAAAPPPGKSVDSKADLAKDRRKPVEVGYQGTARPAKKPVEVGYKGTARPTSAPPPGGRNGASAAKAKAAAPKHKYDGYADWDELSDMEDEEDDYASDGSSDMEGGVWDVEEEEQRALKAARKEDAEALAEEIRLKKIKEERKRKLEAMNKAASTKRKY